MNAGAKDVPRRMELIAVVVMADAGLILAGVMAVAAVDYRLPRPL